MKTVLSVLFTLLVLPSCPALAAEAVSWERIERAWKALRAGDAAAAAPDLVAAAGDMPNTPGILLAAAEALARSGKPAEALAWVERAAAMGGVGDIQRLEEALQGADKKLGADGALAKLRSNAAPIAAGTVAITLEEKDLLPESVAYDPRTRVFYVGSLHKRKIVRVGPDGAAGDFAPQAAEGLWAVLGMKIHPARRELWANSCNPVEASPPISPEDPASVGQAGIFRYDLETGRLIAKHLAGSKEAPVCFNDLVITPDGTAWLSTGPAGVWRLRPGAGAPERFIEHEGFINGIAASDDGSRIFLANHLRGVHVLEPATRTVRPLVLPADVTLSGIDGLYVRGRTLVAVQNGLGRGPERVVQAQLDAALGAVACLVVLDRNHPAYEIPTTGVLVGDDLYYVASSQLRSFENGKVWPPDRLKKSVILKTALAPDGCGPAPEQRPA
jgi:hypothetical protein